MLPAVDLGQLSQQLPPADETSPPVDSFNCNNTHRMLPKNESLRKILVVFSFFETFCTRVGNSERFGQGESSLSYFFPISHDGAMAVVVGGGKRGDPNFWAATRWWQDRGMEVARGQLRPSLTLHSAFLHLWPSCCWVFLARQRKPLVELRVEVQESCSLEVRRCD